MKSVVLAHKILIASACAFSVFLCSWGVLRYRRLGDSGSLTLGVIAGTIAVGLVLYFRTINKRYQKLLLLAVVIFAPSVASAKPVHPEHHETQLQISLVVATQASSIIDVTYLYTPSGINRNDPGVPELRRFELRKNYFWGSALRSGATREITLRADLGAKIYLNDGRWAGMLQTGFLFNTRLHDVREDGYATLPLQLGLGGRPAKSIELLATYRGQPVLFSTEGDNTTETRSGAEHEVGGSFEMATPSQRVLLKIGASYYLAKWNFTGANQGPLTARGPRIRVRTSIQVSRRTSFIVDVLARSERWNNDRTLIGGADRFALPASRRVVGVKLDTTLVFWFRDKLAFRVGLGSGFLLEPPISRDNDRVGDLIFGRLTLGVTSRY